MGASSPLSSAVQTTKTLPLSRAGKAYWISGSVMAWARALGEFGATIMFAGNLMGRTQTMPLAIYINVSRLLFSEPETIDKVLSSRCPQAPRDKLIATSSRRNIVDMTRSFADIGRFIDERTFSLAGPSFILQWRLRLSPYANLFLTTVIGICDSGHSGPWGALQCVSSLWTSGTMCFKISLFADP